MIEYIGQVVGLLPLGISIFVYLYNDRKKTLWFKLISDLLWTLHFILLGQWTGAVINAICILRGGLYLQKERWRWVASLWTPIGFLIVSAIGTLISANGWISLLPLIGSGLAVFGMWCTKPRVMRYFNMPAVTLWLIYGIAIRSWAVIISNSIFLVTQLAAWIRNRE